MSVWLFLSVSLLGTTPLAGDVRTGDGTNIACQNDVLLYKSGALKSCTLSKDRVVYKTGRGADIPCKGGARVWMHKSGSVSACTLSENKVISKPGRGADIPCQQGKRVWLDESGSILSCTLSERRIVAKAGRGDDLVCVEGTQIWLYRSGSVASCTLLAGKLLRRGGRDADLPCSGDAQVWLYRSGNVASCTLTANMTFFASQKNSVSCARDTNASVQDSGELLSCLGDRPAPRSFWMSDKSVSPAADEDLSVSDTTFRDGFHEEP